MSQHIEDSLTQFIIGLPQFFYPLGYHINPHFAETFFQMIGNMTTEDFSDFYSFEKIEPLVETIAISNEREHQTFHQDYLKYIKNQHIIVLPNDKARDFKNKLCSHSSMNDHLNHLDKQIESRKKRIRKMEKTIENHSESVIKEKTQSNYEKEFSKIRKEMKKIFKGSPKEKEILSLHQIAADKNSNLSDKEIDEIREEIKKNLKKAVRFPSSSSIMKYLEKQSSLLKKMKNHNKALPNIGREKQLLEMEEKEYQKTQKKLNDLLDKIRNDARNIKKEKSYYSRNVFLSGHNTVQTELPSSVLDKNFKSLSDEEKNMIREYIEDNARKFKTKISRNIRSGNHHKIDIPQTCKKACRTNGIPIDLEFIKPKKDKARLVMFLDVSGSCKSASEMMLTFMHEMRDIFPGGCETYVFINSLFDVSDIFEESIDSKESVQGILESIPRKGVYSNYYKPFKDFYENYLYKVTKDSIVFFIGDARNNKNPTGEEYIKAISRKAKKTYWLNIDHKEKWNQGDSIIGIYSNYMNMVSETLTTGDLLHFLINAK